MCSQKIAVSLLNLRLQSSTNADHARFALQSRLSELVKRPCQKLRHTLKFSATTPIFGSHVIGYVVYKIDFKNWRCIFELFAKNYFQTETNVAEIFAGKMYLFDGLRRL